MTNYDRAEHSGFRRRLATQTQGATVDLADYLRALRRRWKVILLCLMLSIGAAAAFNHYAEKEYSSTARMYISSTQTSTIEALQGTQLSAARIGSFAAMVTTRELSQRVATSVDGEFDAAQLRSRVSAEVVPETFIIAITATLPDPDGARAVAQAYADGLAAMIDELEQSAPGEAQPIRASVYEAATASAVPISPQPLRNFALATLVGLLLGICAAVTRELLDSTVRAGSDLAKVTELSMLGDVPLDPATRVRDFSDSLDLRAPGMEAYRVLRTNLQFFDVDASGKVLVITSSVSGEGKTTTAVNLAIAHAQVGQRVLLIEGDLRRPRASAALGLDQNVGVTTVLIGKVSLHEAMQVHANGTLHVLSSGAIPPNPAELLQSQAMKDLIQAARREFDLVVIDAPPLLPVTDAAILAALADGAILIVRHGRTRREQVATSVSRLAQVDARAIGFVINMIPGRRGGYGYGYGYGSRESTDPSTKRRQGRRHRVSSPSAQ